MTLTRICLGCGQTDDHPRHVIGLRDGSDVFWHMDCHAHAGCESCAADIAGATGLTGDALREYLTTKDGA